jgi:hypothetical protein
MNAARQRTSAEEVSEPPDGELTEKISRGITAALDAIDYQEKNYTSNGRLRLSVLLGGRTSRTLLFRA